MQQIKFPAKPKLSSNNAAPKRKRNDDETIDLCSDDKPTSPASTKRSKKRPRTEEQALTPPPSQEFSPSDPEESAGATNTNTGPTPPSSQDALQSSSQSSVGVTAAPQLPTPQATPQKSKELYDIPQIADRNVVKRLILEGVEYSNPQKFSLRPPFYKKLSGGEVDKIIYLLREQLDPIPFSRELDRPVDEMKHLLDALLVNPLYDHKEAIKRNEDGMAKTMASFNKDGPENRLWGDAEEGVVQCDGELSGIERGLIQVIRAKKGTIKEYNLEELSDDDKKYLQHTLTPDDMKKLWKDYAEAGSRKWGPKKSGKFVTGMLRCVEVGVVKVVGEKSGTVYDVLMDELSREDKEYLEAELLDDDKAKLWADKDESE